jgi:phosphoserine phosphatase RsbU/P
MNTSGRPTITHFFKNYNRLIGATYFAILALTFAFFVVDLQQKRKNEIDALSGEVMRHAEFIEFTLRSSINQLEAVRIAAPRYYYNSNDKGNPELSSPLFAMLQEKNGGFDLDAAPDRDSTGNLVGRGNLIGRTKSFYQDIAMALSLNSLLQAITFILPSTSETRFVSNENFSHTYPWMESSKRPFDSSVYTTPTWLLGTPEKNPNHKKYWAPVYYGGIETGLLVPVSVPIYACDSSNGPDDFRGIVTMDISLDYLNRINSEFGYKLGKVILVDAFDQIVADPELFSQAMNARPVQPVSGVLPPKILLADGHDHLIPADVPLKISGYIVIRHQFISAPWQLIYLVPNNDLWIRLLAEHGPLMLLIIAGLTLLMVVTYKVTSREFITPASRLVEHIASESRFTPSPIPDVPPAWKPWFETISQAFSESMQLMGLRQELEIATKMQLSILPRHWPVHQCYSLWGLMRSAKEVGGDFYDYFPVDATRIGIVVADVSGKGVPAALFGMVSRTLIRITATRYNYKGGDPLQEANDILCKDNEACNFVTAFYAVFDPENGNFTYVCAGHPPPLLVHEDGHSEFLPMTGSCPLGVSEGLPFAQESIVLQPGDFVLMYTDGVTEAFNNENVAFSPERLPPIFNQHSLGNVRKAVEAVLAAVDRHAESAQQSDDITCVALHYHPRGIKSQ